MPSDGQPLLITPQPDLRILAFTFGLTFATGIIFGLLPALRASRPDPWTTLKDTVGTLAGTGGSLFLRKGLVPRRSRSASCCSSAPASSSAACRISKTTDTGVALDNLVTFQVSPALSGYDDPRTVSFYQQLLERLHRRRA